MGLLNFISSKHSSVNRNYMSRVCDEEMPKHKASSLAKKWDLEYWDGDRRTGYGGYKFVEGYWSELVRSLVLHYGLTSSSRVLDIGCGKGYMLVELEKQVPGIEVKGLDVSNYAINNSHPQIRSKLKVGNCTDLPYQDKEFDLAISINVFHNLFASNLEKALYEISRVSRDSYLVIESYTNEVQKQNLLYWQLTCEAFNTPDEWEWWFRLTSYRGDWEFIFFD